MPRNKKISRHERTTLIAQIAVFPPAAIPLITCVLVEVVAIIIVLTLIPPLEIIATFPIIIAIIHIRLSLALWILPTTSLPPR